MKEKIKEGLEKIVEISKAIKQNGHIGLTTLALPFIINSNIYSSVVGKLEIVNKISSPYTSQDVKILHRTESFEGYDLNDSIYSPMFNPSKIKAKIVSILEEEIEKTELEVDSRPEGSTSSINLELAIHDQDANRGDPVTIDSYNELWCSIDPQNRGYDFGKKPITLWERSIVDPNENPGNPNNYTISFIADIREAIDKSDFYPGGIKNARLILPYLSVTPGSEIPYMYAQANFTIFPGDFNLDGKVNLEDYACWAGCDPVADITGENGLPDGTVDFHDFGLYLRDYLKDSNDQSTW